MKTSIFVFHTARRMWTPEVLKGSKRFKTEIKKKRINHMTTKTMIQIKHIALKSSNCQLAYLTVYIPIYSVLKKKKKNLNLFSFDPVCLGTLQCLGCQTFQLPFQVSSFFLRFGDKLS